MSKKQITETGNEQATTTTAPATTTTAQVHFAINDDMATIFKVMDCPKQVRDICKILLANGEMSQAKLLDAMGDGGITTRQSPEKILAYYQKMLIETVGVTVSTK